MAMRYKLLGKSGLRVSELGLGTMTFGEDWGWGASREESRKIFDLYAEAGGNFIDTANNYTNGTSEKLVGEFIAENREFWVVASKYTLTERPGDPNAGGNHRKNMVQSVERSLKRLNTDYLDLLWLHMWDYTTPVEEILRGLDDLVHQGKVLYIGLSDSPAWVAAYGVAISELRGWSRFVALQFPYSLVGRDPDRELIPMAESLDLGVVAWGVIEQGGLTGKYNRDTSEPRRFENTTERNKALSVELQQIARETGYTPAQLLLNWVRHQKRAIPLIPLVGARSATQMAENLGCLDKPLSEEVLEQVSGLHQFKPGFPVAFLRDEEVRGLIFGTTFSQLDNHRVK
jgi:aryl-alcohol dehydrogenase-like predicted oxidoreductase